MNNKVKIAGLAVSLLLATPAVADDWQLQPAGQGTGTTLVVPASETVIYRFECTADDIAISQTGVTELLDLGTGEKIDDGPDAVMPPGAAMMALFAGKGDPDFKPAAAVKNPAGGWDLTMRLSKTDKQLRAIGKSDMMSLFTTGYTIAVAIDGPARAQWNAFLERCKTAG